MAVDLREQLDRPPSVPFRYVKPLDGVRGLGILIVMFGHYSTGLSKWAGVRFFGVSLTIDLFFVLSGFLITTLLLEEWSKNQRISLRNFYVRRGLRLLPALYVLLACVVVVPLVTDWLPLKLTFAEAAAAALYVYPVVLFGKGGNVFLFHLWTLSVEEWFYFLWPTALLWWGFGRRRVRKLTGLLWGLVGACVVCFLLRAAGGRDPLSLLIAALRPDSLLYGALLAFFMRWCREFPDERRDRILRIVARIGSVGFLYFSWIATYPITPTPKGETYADHYARYHEVSFQSWNYRFGMICALLLIMHVLLVPDGWLSKFFSWRPLVHLGILSYALYLWHQVLFLLVNDRSNLNADPTQAGHTVLSVWQKWGVALAVGAVSIFISQLSRWFIEVPALRMKKRFEVVNYQDKR
jgi:peptidoglycan/LPS O-acetylase OafA/YrhL